MNRLKRSSNILHLVTLSALGQNKKSKVLQDKINDNGSVDGDPELPGLGPFLPSSQDSMKPLQGMHVVQRDINKHSSQARKKMARNLVEHVEVRMDPAMSRKSRKTSGSTPSRAPKDIDEEESWHNEKRKNVFSCTVAAHTSTRKCIKETQNKDH